MPKIGKISLTDIDNSLSQSAKTMKDILDAEPKISFLIPLMPGEVEGAYDTVCINGYVTQIKKGVMAPLPKSIVDILSNKYNIEMTAGREMLVDRDEETQKALS